MSVICCMLFSFFNYISVYICSMLYIMSDVRIHVHIFSSDTSHTCIYIYIEREMLLKQKLKHEPYKPEAGHLLYDSSLLLLTAAYSISIRPSRKAD